MSSVVLQGVSKAYDKKCIIDKIDLHVKNKEFLVLVGPSGCGKSTLLRMIAGLEDVTAGEIYIGDKKVNNVHPKDRDIAFVFQNYALYPHMTVKENLAFGLKMRLSRLSQAHKMRGADKKTIEKKVAEAARILDLDEYLERKPKQLSGGQRQRVALGRAIVRNPKVFLMDEPLSNLDAKLRVQMRSEIKKLHEKLQTTFIYVTHDQTEALTMGDRVVVLDKGVIQQADTPAQIYNNPANTFVAGFVGSPQMNFITGSTVFGAEENVTVGIRPEKMVCGGEIKFSADVDMVELLGSEKIVHFCIDEGKCADSACRERRKCTAKLPADYPVSQKIELSVKKSDIYFFNHDGRRING